MAAAGAGCSCRNAIAVAISFLKDLSIVRFSGTAFSKSEVMLSEVFGIIGPFFHVEHTLCASPQMKMPSKMQCANLSCKYSS